MDTTDGPINVVVTASMRLPESMLDEWRAVNPRLQFSRVSREQRPYLAAGKGGAPEAEARELQAMLAEAEIVLSAYEAPRDLLERAPKLRWFHTFAAGIERYVESGFLREGLLFTNGSGPSSVPIAEYVVMMMLMMAKNAAGYVRQQDEHKWVRGRGVELRGKTVGIIGLGQIGAETGRLAKALGCRVIGSRRSVTTAREDAEGVDLLLPASNLARLLGESDFVVLAAPATAETRALLDAESFALMKQGSYLVNIARGSMVDEAALVAALKSGHVAGAALDVFDPEPLPPDSELWQLPQVLITPHVSSASEHSMGRQMEICRQNLQRYIRGEKLLNLVPPGRGY
jgi:D-2-hydroxyacid dehydrogenase (NADP+)